MYTLYHDDCLDRMKQLANDGVQVDLILTDPPYGTIKTLGASTEKFNKNRSWDSKIDTDEMYNFCCNLLRKNGTLVLFSQEPYTSELRTIKKSVLDFKYPLIWKKDHFANHLGHKKAPVSYFEDINVYRKQYDYPEKDHPLRDYSKKILYFLGLKKGEIHKRMGNNAMFHFFEHDNISFGCPSEKSYSLFLQKFNLKPMKQSDIHKKLNHTKTDHFFTTATQFGIPSKHAYEEFIDVFDLDSVGGILTFDELKRIDNEYKKNHPVIFNLPGNSKFKSNILEYKKDHYNKLHPTQKPVALLEDLIKTYTNPGDLVLDFTMGSGSTGVACQNTDRDFIGIELDENYFKIAEKRLKENTVQTNLITNNNEVKGESK